MARPFRVEQSVLSPGKWRLYRQATPKQRVLVGYFDSIAQAHNHVRKNWPWWP